MCLCKHISILDLVHMSLFQCIFKHSLQTCLCSNKVSWDQAVILHCVSAKLDQNLDVERLWSWETDRLLEKLNKTVDFYCLFYSIDVRTDSLWVIRSTLQVNDVPTISTQTCEWFHLNKHVAFDFPCIASHIYAGLRDPVLWPQCFVSNYLRSRSATECKNAMIFIEARIDWHCEAKQELHCCHAFPGI